MQWPIAAGSGGLACAETSATRSAAASSERPAGSPSVGSLRSGIEMIEPLLLRALTVAIRASLAAAACIRSSHCSATTQSLLRITTSAGANRSKASLQLSTKPRLLSCSM
uniref:Unannotated protein n=1 Tax=freshwater metagenome TaxID=449393 RepID=A0A6J6A3G8_9ZZZZ